MGAVSAVTAALPRALHSASEIAGEHIVAQRTTGVAGLTGPFRPLGLVRWLTAVVIRSAPGSG